MKLSHLIYAAPIALCGMLLTSCDSKEDTVRKQVIENEADALENEAKLMEKKGEAAATATDDAADRLRNQTGNSGDHATRAADVRADSAEHQADLVRDAADREAERLREAADAVRDQK